MRYIFKHSGVCSGKETPTFYVLFLIQENVWAGELGTFFTVLRKGIARRSTFFLIIIIIFFYMEEVLMSLHALKLFLSLLCYSSLHEENEQVAWLSDQH